jgi:hypothetical protein
VNVKAREEKGWGNWAGVCRLAWMARRVSAGTLQLEKRCLAPGGLQGPLRE